MFFQLNKENPETSPLQLAIGEAVTALATGESKADVYETRMETERRKLRPEVIDAVLTRTFGASKVCFRELDGFGELANFRSIKFS